MPSGQPCGCDPGCRTTRGTIGHICERHREEGHVRLSELHPQFLGAGGEGVRQPSDRPCPKCAGAGCEDCHQTGKEYEPAPVRWGVGVLCNCPCGNDDENHKLYVPFLNPLDGGPALSPHGWTRTGNSFDNLTLTPSILRSKARGGCGWHGFITDGTVAGQIEG